MTWSPSLNLPSVRRWGFTKFPIAAVASPTGPLGAVVAIDVNADTLLMLTRHGHVLSQTAGAR